VIRIKASLVKHLKKERDYPPVGGDQISYYFDSRDGRDVLTILNKKSTATGLDIKISFGPSIDCAFLFGKNRVEYI